jgi:hypothetical protein
LFLTIKKVYAVKDLSYPLTFYYYFSSCEKSGPDL